MIMQIWSALLSTSSPMRDAKVDHRPLSKGGKHCLDGFVIDFLAGREAIPIYAAIDGSVDEIIESIN